jgi:hypothetical protein
VPDRAKQGETYTSSGIFKGLKITGILEPRPGKLRRRDEPVEDANVPCFKNLRARCHYRPTALGAAALERKGSANRRNDNNLTGNCPKPISFFRRR